MEQDKPVAKGENPVAIEDGAIEQFAIHSLGATAGAIGGAVLGAICGIAAGPVGSLAGAAAGAVLGGAAGASTGMLGSGPEAASEREHDAYWRDNYAARPYVPGGARYEDYEPAYRYGMQSYLRLRDPRGWDEIEPELGAGWPAARERSGLAWEDARHAVRDAWERMRDIG
jgi:hypothetical protein